MKKIFIVLFFIMLGSIRISANATETIEENSNISGNAYLVEPAGYNDTNFTYHYETREV